MWRAPWNEDDADTGGWGDLFGGILLVGVGTALLVCVAIAEPVAIRGLALTDGQAACAGVVLVLAGAALAAWGYGFRLSDWRQRRRRRQTAARRRPVRRRTRRR